MRFIDPPGKQRHPCQGWGKAGVDQPPCLRLNNICMLIDYCCAHCITVSLDQVCVCGENLRGRVKPQISSCRDHRGTKKKADERQDSGDKVALRAPRSLIDRRPWQRFLFRTKGFCGNTSGFARLVVVVILACLGSAWSCNPSVRPAE